MTNPLDITLPNNLTIDAQLIGLAVGLRESADEYERTGSIDPYPAAYLERVANSIMLIHEALNVLSTNRPLTYVRGDESQQTKDAPSETLEDAYRNSGHWAMGQHHL